MKRALIVGTAVFGLMMGTVATAWADEGNRGNHGPVWGLDVPGHDKASGTDWGPAASSAATAGHLQGGVIAKGVHDVKNNGPENAPGQNK